MGRRLQADRTADGDGAASISADVQRSYERITMAPVVIALCLSMVDMDHYPDAARNQAEMEMAIQSTAIAGGYLLLAAEAEGLGSCWTCAPLFCPDVVRQALALPSDWIPQGLILLGYRAETRPPKPRKPLSSVMTTR